MTHKQIKVTTKNDVGSEELHVHKTIKVASSAETTR